MAARLTRVPPQLVRAARRQRAARQLALRRARTAFRLRRLRRAVTAAGLIALGGIGTGIALGGLDDTTWLMLMAGGLSAFVLLAIYPALPEIRAGDVDEASLPELAGSVETWLEARRPALPAPAVDMIDMIGVRLEGLSPQLAALDERGPAAHEVRKLLGEHLCGLVESYTRIPPSLRDRPGNAGVSPSQQLVEGLGVISDQIEAVSHDLSRGDVDALAIRNRYLETRYSGEEA